MKETLESKRSIYLHQINNLIPSCFSNNLTLLEFVNRYYFCDWHTHLIGGIVIITVTCPSHIFSRNTKIKWNVFCWVPTREISKQDLKLFIATLKILNFTWEKNKNTSHKIHTYPYSHSDFISYKLAINFFLYFSIKEFFFISYGFSFCFSGPLFILVICSLQKQTGAGERKNVER